MMTQKTFIKLCLIVSFLYFTKTKGISKSIRIQGPSSLKGIGRVEVFYNGTWGTICDNGWDVNDARVVCRELGHLNAVKALKGGQVPSGSGKIWLEGVGCTGEEKNLASCSLQNWGIHNCNHSTDAGVECTSTVGPYVTYLIKSEQFGYVHRYGIFRHLDLLQFLKTRVGAAHFRFTSKSVLQEMNTGKCVKIEPNLILILSNDCDGPAAAKWTHNSVDKHLKFLPTTSGDSKCFSPWKHTVEPKNIEVITGLSNCRAWNRIVLEADYDECALNIHNCGANSHCVKSVGRFSCVCNKGYTEVGATCTGPSKPRNVTMTVNGSIIIIKWLPPEVSYSSVDHYLVFWRREKRDGNFHKTNVTASPFIHNFGNEFGQYTIKVQAVDNDVVGEAAYVKNLMIKSKPKMQTTNKIVYFTDNVTTPRDPTVQPNLKKNRESRPDKAAIAAGVIGAIIFLILAVIICFFLLKIIRRRRRRKSLKDFETSQAEMRDKRRHYPSSRVSNSEQSMENDKLQSEELTYVRLLNNWEIPPNRLKVLDEILGIGKFGIVKKGLYTASLGEEPVQVAVKMLKNNPTESDVSDFLDELEMLKKTNKEPHPNVIRFIGACISEEKLMVVTEYCFSGNLQSFLKKRRVIDNSSTSDSKYVKTTSTLDSRQLLKIGVDVASGMVHLSDLKLVHRDLAARNILINCIDNVAKITDFGLTRDIANTEEYMRTNQDLLPVKWMALESLLHGRFTTASDVWSFGVLLYEIVTLGEIPYKHLSPFAIVSYIGSGGRLQKPPNCSNEIYKIMMNCWDVDEKKRPSFFQLRKYLHDMLMDDQKSYINVQQVKDEELRTTTTPCHVTVEDEAALKL